MAKYKTCYRWRVTVDRPPPQPVPNSNEQEKIRKFLNNEKNKQIEQNIYEILSF